MSFNRIYKPQVEVEEYVPASSVYVKNIVGIVVPLGFNYSGPYNTYTYLESVNNAWVYHGYGGFEYRIPEYITNHPTHTFTFVSDSGYETINGITGQVWEWQIYNTIPEHYHTVLQDDIGWNSAAISIASISESCSATFRIMSSSAGVVCGITNIVNATETERTSILFTFYAVNGEYCIYESGVEKTGFTPFTDTDTFKIDLIEFVGVFYYVNNILVYTSESIVDGFNYVVDAAFYKSGDTIWDATFTEVDITIIPSILIEINIATDYIKGIPFLKPAMYIIT